MEARNFIKLHHYKTYLREITGIINSRYVMVAEIQNEIKPRIMEMKYKTQWIRNSCPQLARSVNVIGDFLMETHDSGSPRSEGSITMVQVVTKLLLDILKEQIGTENRNRALEDLRKRVEEHLPPLSLTFTNLINSAMDI